jgi:hypothetical protein
VVATSETGEVTTERHSDDSAGAGPTALGVTPNVQRVCEESTKYPGKGMLHNFF